MPSFKSLFESRMATGPPPREASIGNLAERIRGRVGRHFGTSPDTTEALALIGAGFLTQLGSDVVANHLTGCVDSDSVIAALKGRGLHKLARQAEKMAVRIRIDRRDAEYQALREAPYAIHGLPELATLLGEYAVPVPTRAGARGRSRTGRSGKAGRGRRRSGRRSSF